METRVCSDCEKEKPQSEYYKNQSQCIPCFLLRCKDYRESTGYQKVRHRGRKIEVVSYKGGECAFCGESTPCALQMHHLDPSAKKFTFGSLSNFKNGEWESGFWKSEADKCILICANCHYKIHSGVICIDEGGSYYNE